MKSEATTPNGEHLLLMDKVVFHFLIILSKKKIIPFNSFNLKTPFSSKLKILMAIKEQKTWHLGDFMS